jgi:hypothetical protein
MEHGTDRYGQVRSPILVSILDVETRVCPEQPLPVDEAYRVIRRDRRNPAGANLLTDQPLLKTLYLLSAATGRESYARFASAYVDWYFKHLVDDKGFVWWGWHRHYDVYRDEMTGHQGNHHEIHAIHAIAWDRLWEVNAAAVRREIEALWQWHVVDKTTGEINRHGDGQPGCDFAMSAGACIEAFAFLFGKTQDRIWLDRARLLADYYWNRRHPATHLFPDRPNAGPNRFDGGSFVTSITGLHCHSLLKAWELTGEAVFRDYAVAYLKAYAQYGYDERRRMFWGALRLDGSPLAGPRLFIGTDTEARGYQAYEPRGYLDLWQPYAAGYEHPIATAQVYAYAHHLTGDAALLTTAERFADCIERMPPGSPPPQDAWYKQYSDGPGRRGTYAGEYGRAVSFFIHLYILTGQPQHLRQARSLADEAIAKLHHNGLFRGHPAKPYYEAIDGVGYLLYALLELHCCWNAPQEMLRAKALWIGEEPAKTPVGLDNW